MLTLFQLPPSWGIPSFSPPCMKLETWLRMTGIPYEVGVFNLARAPKAKLPYLEDQGELMCDSTLVLDPLMARYKVDPDRGLGAVDRAVGLAVRRMLKEHMYWMIVYFRWREEPSFQVMRQTFLSFLPSALPEAARDQIIARTRADLLEQLRQQGMGRHSPDEVLRLASADLEAASVLLGGKPFFFGDEPTTIDATLYATVSNIIDAPIASPLRDLASRHASLVAHTRRMERRYFPELAAARG